MNYIRCCLLILLTAFLRPCDGQTSKVWVFILAGQSNMAGRGTIEAQDTVADPRILAINANGQMVHAKEPLHFYEPKMAGLDCGLSFGKELLLHIPADVKVLIVPTAVGGSAIDQWLTNETFRGVPLMANFKEKVAIAKRYGEIKAILWHQGESDAKPAGIPVHREKLKELFSSFRATAGDPKLPVLIGELGSFSKTSAELFAQMNEQLRQYSAGDLRTAIIPTGDLKDKGDNLHFNSEGQREMGRRFARAYIARFTQL